MYIHDLPIKKRQQDMLGRTEFANHLADSILQWDSEESIVIALYGTWGCGKTSVINMVVERIEEANEEERPIVVRFNPWMFSGTGQMLAMFFRELLCSLAEPSREKLIEVREKLRKYANLLTPLLRLLPYGEVAEDVVKTIAGSYEASSESIEQTLQHLREQLDKELREAKQRVLVIIDDIDRLTPAEIRCMFRFVKICANFPYTTYLLAFDRDVVERSLGEDGIFSGASYLEKIVQVGYDVPVVEQTRLERILQDHLNEVFCQIPEEKINRTWDNTRWWNVYYAGFRNFFTTIRDIKRYVNGLNFNLRLILGEVNIIDFLVIEALRIFVPEVYHSIKRNKLIFTSVGDKEDSTEIKEAFEKLISNSDEKIPRDAILGVCKELFPKVKRAYTNIGYSDKQPLLWRRELRVCSPEMFDRYFLLSVPEMDVSETEVQHILSKAAGFREFIEQLLSLYGEGRLRSFLRKMIDRFEEIPKENIPKIVHALIDLGDRVEEDSSGLFDSGSHGDIDEVIRRLLRRVPSTLKRTEIIQTAIEQTQGIYYPMRIVGFYEHEIKRYIEGFTLEEPSFDEESISTLRGLCLEKVRNAAKSGMLQSMQKLGHILVYWQRWSESDDAKKYAMDLAETPRGAVTVLAGFLTRSWSFSFGDYVARQEWRIPLDTIAQLVDVEFLSRKIDELENDEYEKLSDKEKIAIEIFRKQVRERNHREDA